MTELTGGRKQLSQFKRYLQIKFKIMRPFAQKGKGMSNLLRTLSKMT